MRDYLAEVKSAIATMRANGVKPSVRGVALAIKASNEHVGRAFHVLRESGSLDRIARRPRQARGPTIEVLRDMIADLAKQAVAAGEYPTVAWLATQTGVCPDRVAYAARDLRLAGAFPDHREAHKFRKATPLPKHIPGELDPKFHDLRMVFHQTRHELRGEAIPWRIKAKYVPVPSRSVNRRIEA